MGDYLRLERVRKSYDGKVAVKDLDLTVPEGSVYGIIGPNGAGKTTTIRMVMNIIAPDSGRILARGKPVDESFKNVVGYLPEERGLYKKMKVWEVIRYMAQLKGYRPKTWSEEVDRWLTLMDLSDRRNRKVEELSKGMQQKLQFITTVFHKPELIVLDELFSGLDPLNVEIMKNALLTLRKEGATILFSTHVMEQAEQMVDYLTMLRDGEKVLDGRLQDIKASFGRKTIHLSLDGDTALVRAHPTVDRVVEFANYLEVDLKSGGDHMTLLRDVAQAARVNRFELVEPSLYNIFIRAAKIDPVAVRPTGGEVTHV